MDGVSHLAGVNLVDCYLIERLVKAANTRTLRTSNNSLGMISPHIFALSEIFCPPTVLPMGPLAFVPGGAPVPLYPVVSGGRRIMGVAIPPSPAEVRNRLADRFHRRAGIHDVPSVPEVSETIPDDVMALLSRVGEKGTHDETLSVNRWRITFVSASPLADSKAG